MQQLICDSINDFISTCVLYFHQLLGYKWLLLFPFLQAAYLQKPHRKLSIHLSKLQSRFLRLEKVCFASDQNSRRKKRRSNLLFGLPPSLYQKSQVSHFYHQMVIVKLPNRICCIFQEIVLRRLVLLPSLGSARKARFQARGFGQKARLGSACSIFQKARNPKIWKTELFSRIS